VLMFCSFTFVFKDVFFWSCCSSPISSFHSSIAKPPPTHRRSRLFHEFARNVEQATEAAAGASSCSAAATSLALHVKLERHLGSLSDSVLLGSSGVLGMVS
jgi:hypothetical protein